MRITYDKDADAAYVYLMQDKKEIASTKGNWPFHVDIDRDGEIIGIEVMDASSILSRDFLDKSNT